VMLPGCDGFSVVEQLRERDDRTPVLMLTARGRPEDVLRGFEAGADDYLPKPFDLSILLARLNGLLRRMKWHRPVESNRAPTEELSRFTFAERTIDFEALELTSFGKTIRLTLMEADLLRHL